MSHRKIYKFYYLRRVDKRDILDLNEWCPFYAGIGKNEREKDHRKEALKLLQNPNANNTNPIRNYIIHKLWFQGLDFIEDIIFVNLTKEEAAEIEMEAISAYGRIDLGTGCLANLTNGGEGCIGLSKESLLRMSEAIRQLWQDPEYRQRQVDAHVGQTLSPERNISLHEGSTKYWTGRPKSPEHCAKISETLTGRPSAMSPEQIEELSLRMMGNSYAAGTTWTEERKQYMSERFSGENNPAYGVVRSPEHCKKLSISCTGRKAWNKGTKGVMKAWNKGKKMGPQSEESKRNKSLSLTKTKRFNMLKSILEFVITQKELNSD